LLFFIFIYFYFILNFSLFYFLFYFYFFIFSPLGPAHPSWADREAAGEQGGRLTHCDGGTPQVPSVHPAFGPVLCAGLLIRIRIRIRIQTGQWIRNRNRDPDPGGQKWPHKSKKKFEVSDGLFWKLKASSVTWTPRDSKLKFLIQKKFNFFFSCNFFFNFWSLKLWIRIGIQPKMLDPDEMNADPQLWLCGSGTFLAWPVPGSEAVPDFFFT
jgi:hypothetical protein